MKKLCTLLLLFGLLSPLNMVHATSRYQLDTVHSTVGFTVKHLMFSTVRGKFNEVRASVDINEDTKELSNIRAEMMVASIDTDNEDRDAHLRSNDFFNAERFPRITFESSRIQRLSGNQYRVDGTLTIRDVSKQITLEGEMMGMLPGRAAFRAEGEINRQDFNVTWNKPLQQAGGVTVSDEVGLVIEVAMFVPEN